MSNFKSFLATKTGKYVMTFVFALVLFALLFLAVESDVDAFMFIVVLACAVCGWRALNRITPSIFLWMSWVGWVIYFILKGFLSVVIGIVVAPFQIAAVISDAVHKSIASS